MKSPFYKFTGFEANIQPDSKENEDFYSINWKIDCNEFNLREYAYRFIAEDVMDELREYEDPVAYVFISVESPFPGWDDDILFARICFDSQGNPCPQLLVTWEDL